jgi:catechol 2,3-dioxygenase-like lactoylglutathione lyase family enzyme
MQFIQIKETSLYVFSLDNSKRFYNGLLGLDIISEATGRHIFFKAGTSVLLCFIAGSTANDTKLPPHGGKGKIHIAFEVSKENYVKTRKELEDNGIAIEQEENWPGGFQSFYFRDPDDHLLEIVQEGMWG